MNAPVTPELIIEFREWYHTDRKKRGLTLIKLHPSYTHQIHEKYEAWYRVIYSAKLTNAKQSRARKTDPWTSHFAAARVNVLATDRQILSAINSGFITIKEVSIHLDATKETSYSPRFAPLTRAGLIELNGRKKNAATGRPANAYRLTPAGHRALS